MSDRIDEIESRLRDMGAPQQPTDGGGAPATPSLRPPEPAPEAEPRGDARRRGGPGVGGARAVAQHAEGELRVPDGYHALSGGVDGQRAVGIVVSRFNGEITNRLLKEALAELEEVGVPREAIMVMPVPGAFELPLAAMALAKTRRYACIVALGA